MDRQAYLYKGKWEVAEVPLPEFGPLDVAPNE